MPRRRGALPASIAIAAGALAACNGQSDADNTPAKPRPPTSIQSPLSRGPATPLAYVDPAIAAIQVVHATVEGLPATFDDGAVEELKASVDAIIGRETEQRYRWKSGVEDVVLPTPLPESLRGGVIEVELQRLSVALRAANAAEFRRDPEAGIDAILDAYEKSATDPNVAAEFREFINASPMEGVKPTLQARGLNDPNTLYLVVYDGPAPAHITTMLSGTPICGYSNSRDGSHPEPRLASLIFAGPVCHNPLSTPAGIERAAAYASHEMWHDHGLAARCARNDDGNFHVTDDPDDFLAQFARPVDPALLRADRNRDDYLEITTPGCPSLERSPFLLAPEAVEVSIARAFEENGGAGRFGRGRSGSYRSKGVWYREFENGWVGVKGDRAVAHVGDGAPRRLALRVPATARHHDSLSRRRWLADLGRDQRRQQGCQSRLALLRRCG